MTTQIQAILSSEHFVPGPYTLDLLTAAPPFAVFVGDAEHPGEFPWIVSELDGCTVGDTDEASRITGLDVLNEEPERDDEACSQLEQRNSRGLPFDDCDAWLAHLRSGGALCKVPDYDGSPFYRLLVVNLGATVVT